MRGIAHLLPEALCRYGCESADCLNPQQRGNFFRSHYELSSKSPRTQSPGNPEGPDPHLLCVSVDATFHARHVASPAQKSPGSVDNPQIAKVVFNQNRVVFVETTKRFFED